MIDNTIDTSTQLSTQLFESLRANSFHVRNTTASERIAKLKKLKQVVLEHRIDIQDALKISLEKPTLESDFTEILPLNMHIDFVCKHLAHWMRPKSVPTLKEQFGTSSKIIFEPKGTVLIIAPWNYAFFLCLDPLVSAIAAGNTVMLKPSEMSNSVYPILKKIIGKVFHENEVCVVDGDVAFTTEILKLPFNHIFFTGSPAVGKIIMKAAAEHLSSVTLELGGKSPVVVHEDANLKMSAERIAFGKFVNTGQTCIAPDYVLVQNKVKKEFLEQLKTTINSMYGTSEEEKIANKDYGRIINDRQFDRLVSTLEEALIAGAQLKVGGAHKKSERYISPTVLTDVEDHSRILNEEIFGPILPVIGYDNLDEAIDYINNKERPLALYIFTNATKTSKQILNNVTAGGCAVNDCLSHIVNLELPFGGINNSGLGKSRGKFGFDEFSNMKGVLTASRWISFDKIIGAPYTNTKKKLVNFMLKWL